jgi:hypothetical protein
VWNGSPPSRKKRELELIVGGDLNHPEEAYVRRLHESIEVCFALLKPHRWLSVVFQHWSPAYFDAILTAAAAAGGDLRAAISQIGDPIWSMHKKKNRESVLAGEMILTFFKTGKAKRVEVSGAFDLRREYVLLVRWATWIFAAYSSTAMKNGSLPDSRCRLWHTVKKEQ